MQISVLVKEEHTHTRVSLGARKNKKRAANDIQSVRTLHIRFAENFLNANLRIAIATAATTHTYTEHTSTCGKRRIKIEKIFNFIVVFPLDPSTRSLADFCSALPSPHLSDLPFGFIYFRSLHFSSFYSTVFASFAHVSFLMQSRVKAENWYVRNVDAFLFWNSLGSITS